MEVPVLAIVDWDNPKISSRWKPYLSIVRTVSPKDFDKFKFDFDFVNPTPNSNAYLEIRDKLDASIDDFVVNDYKLSTWTKFREDEILLWQNNLMKTALIDWQKENKKIISAGLKTLVSKTLSVFVKDFSYYFWRFMNNGF